MPAASRPLGYAFPADGDWQRDFETRFEYDETDDQLACAAEIKKDMERPHPMDRLLCGDVGVGKTEVALRAAFKCIMGGKQCAILVPTTILAWQHYQTAAARMQAFPVEDGAVIPLCHAQSRCVPPCAALRTAQWTLWWAHTAFCRRM